jgi:hypothetical protein
MSAVIKTGERRLRVFCPAHSVHSAREVAKMALAVSQ